ncbi:MAG TPA: hypothetical protein VMU60_09625 [Syntrophobacteria bacterium]|nr:hypothetical protein [Syntrophobacteria bacterium]
MRTIKGLLFFLFAFLIGGIGACSLVSYGVDVMADGAKTADCNGDEYIVPDMHEFISGGACIEQYCNKVSAKCQCVQFTGEVTLVHPGTLRFTAESKPYMIVDLSVDGGIKTIPVYAGSKFNQQLQELKPNQSITIKGRALALDDSLGVLLKEIEVEPQ